VSETQFTGGCLCGGVRFEIRAPLGPAGYCHCTRCQRRTGTAASAQAAVEPGSLAVTAGDHLVRAYKPEDGYAKVFCSTCGSSLWSVRPGEDEPASVRLGAIDGDPGVRPSYRQHVQSAAAWEPLPDDGLPRYPRSRPS
jgi:hypothetical protein